MKCLIIGGNRFVGLRLSLLLEKIQGLELHILNRTGQAPHCKSAVIHKGDRRNLQLTFLDKDWDIIFDFAAYTAPDIESSFAYFKSVKRYAFISTVSVYDFGSNLKEEAFNPNTWNLETPTDYSYQHGKRVCESLLAQKRIFPVLSVRFPLILGPDDYTHRLDFHLENAKSGEPIYTPNEKAQFSMIHAEDAAQFLKWSVDQKLDGPLNVASNKPISMTELLAQIELVTGDKPRLATKDTPESHSPYAFENDLFVNVDKLNQAGFKARPILDWLPDLIGKPNTNNPKGFVH